MTIYVGHSNGMTFVKMYVMISCHFLVDVEKKIAKKSFIPYFTVWQYMTYVVLFLVVILM